MKLALAPQIVERLRLEAQAYCDGYMAAVTNIITVRQQEAANGDTEQQRAIPPAGPVEEPSAS
jgi:hypothetical protein